MHGSTIKPGCSATLPVTQAVAQSNLNPRPPSAIQISTTSPSIDSGLFSPHFFTRMPVLGSSFVPAIHYTSTTNEDAHYPDSSNPNGEHHLPQQVFNLKSAITQQTTLVNQLI
ncbi:hypothetical protein ACFX16_003277 [Malus domestica]